MRAKLTMFLVLPIILIGCHFGSHESRSQLAFYIVSTEKVEGGQSIDTPELPKLGFVRPVPDFFASRLQSAFTNTVHSILNVEGTGEHEEAWVPGVTIIFSPTDSRRVANFKQQISHKESILLMLNQKPLGEFVMPGSPEMKWPGAEQTPFIFLSLRSHQDINIIVRDLQRFIPN